jgi:enoyl-CoA hydratase
MEYTGIIYEKAEGVAKITINRTEVMNALNAATVKELIHALNEAKNDNTVHVVILTGSGEKAFIAGADISEIKASFEKGPMAARDEFALPGQGLVTTIERLGKPVIAAVNGYALGGGSEIIQACHLALASENARIGQPEINLAFNPCWGGTARLPRQVGRKKALEMILTGDMIDANEAHRIGLVNAVVPLAELLPTAEELAKKVAAKSAVAVRLCLDAVLQGLEMSQTEALIKEANLFGLAADTDDSTEGVAAFLEKRKPVFKNK